MKVFKLQKDKVSINKKEVTIQKGIATFVRKSRGIPTRVIPIIDSNAIIPKQILWQT